jgi:murein DD-endopeptidase MepM/ murein hydrolase activator NlpD
MKPSLYFPVKPSFVNQTFGANKDYYLSHLGTNGHMGIDFAAGHGQPVYASHDGQAVFVRDDHGGEGIHLYGRGYKTIYWHLIGNTDKNYPPQIPTDGSWHTVKAGDIVGYANNTGAPYESSGDHLHFGLYMLDATENIANPSNRFNGAVDPAPFLNGLYAQDIPSLIKIYTALLTALQHMIPLLRAKM